MARSTLAAVWLVRAGPTVWDEEGRLCGSTDLPLSTRGLEQAHERARVLKGQVLPTVLCGPDEASLATAKVVADACGCKVKPADGLREVGFGLWEGVLKAQIEDRCSKTFRTWKDDPAMVSIPGGEPLADAQERMLEVFRKLLPKHADKPGTLAVVLRPFCFGLARCWIQDVPTSELWTLAAQGTGVERLSVDCSRLRERLGLIGGLLKASAAR